MVDTNVMVPLSFLRDVVELLGSFDDTYSSECGYNPQYDYAFTLWELNRKVQKLDLMEIYMQAINDMTEEEKHWLREWVAYGNSVFNNPWSLYDGSGRPMDFINGCRTGIDMSGNTSDYFGGKMLGTRDNGWEEDGDLPF